MDPKLAAQLVMVIGAAMGIACLYGLVFPKQLISWISSFWKNRASFLLAIAVRLVFGALLIFAASATKHEATFTFLGYLMILAGVLVAILGKTKIGMMILWVKTWPLLWVRSWLVFGLIFAGFIVVGTR